MKKKIKILIASISVLLVISVATAITVPLVIQTNKTNVENNTVEKAIIKADSPSTQEILNARTEVDAQRIVKTFNEQKQWDEVFTFVSENDKELKNVVENVFFELENTSSNSEAIFSINYKDGIKNNDNASVIKANMKKIHIFINRAVDYDTKLINSTNVLNNLLIGNFDNQKAIYESWSLEAPAEFKLAIKDILKFNNNITWDEAVKIVNLIPGKFPDPNQEIPSVEIEIKLNDKYSVNIGNNLLKFRSNNLSNSSKIDLTIDKNLNYDTKLNDVNLALENLLNGKSFQEQKATYDDWKTNTPVAINDAIVDIVNFSGGQVSWIDAFKSVSLKPNTFPNDVSQTIPSIEITIQLNDKYNVTSGQDLLKFNSRDLGVAAKIDLTIDKNLNYDTKLNDVNLVLKTLLNGKSFQEQKVAYDDWKINTPVEVINAIVDIVNFNGGQVNWIDAFKSVSLKPSTFPNDFNLTIPGIEITIQLNDKYNVTSGQDLLIFNSEDLGVAAKIKVNVRPVEVQRRNLSIILKDLLSGKTLGEQKIIYDGWGVNNLPPNFESTLQKTIIFDEGNLNWSDVVRNFEFIKESAFPDKPNNLIPHIRIKINLNEKYSASNPFVLIFNLSDLGNTGPI
ncbi:MAG: hypothetical protein ACRC8C_03100 [Mycoplasmoidaceae bacterium]